MKQVPQISEAEWEVMQVLWAKSPQTSLQVIRTLEKTKSWSPRTIRAMMTRLVKKQALGFRKITESTYRYYQLVSESDCQKAEAMSFLQRVYQGAAKTCLLHFFQTGSLSVQEREKLKQELEELQQALEEENVDRGI